ncbi:unnamed protein product [Coregonus sp. 'balchen']|nr:unnamed protein product [Coregonus sp. 'balchen']
MVTLTIGECDQSGLRHHLKAKAGIKGFLEFGSHKEAVNMVDHFGESKGFVNGNSLTLYLSPVVCSIYTPKLDEPPEKWPIKQVTNTVVCFSHVPPGKERESEILILAILGMCDF